jgi:hypothetical protein
MGGLFGRQRHLGHTRLGVDFEEHQFTILACRVVVAEIAPRQSTTAKGRMCG